MKTMPWRLVVVVTSLVVIGTIGVSNGWFGEVCEDRLASVGTDAFVRVCRPVRVTDVPVIALGMAVLLLLWPEIQKISVASISFEKAVKAVEKRTNDTLEAVRVEINNLGAELSQAQRQTQHTTTKLTVVTPNDRARVVRENDLVLQDLVASGLITDAPTDPPHGSTASAESRFVLALERAELAIEWMDHIDGAQQEVFNGPRTVPEIEAIVEDRSVMAPPLLGYSVSLMAAFELLPEIMGLSNPFSATLLKAREMRSLVIDLSEPMPRPDVLGTSAQALETLAALLLEVIADEGPVHG